MTLVIETNDQYKALFEELAKALGATIHVDDLNASDTEQAVLDRVDRGYQQAKANERGEVQLRTLNDFLKTI